MGSRRAESRPTHLKAPSEWLNSSWLWAWLSFACCGPPGKVGFPELCFAPAVPAKTESLGPSCIGQLSKVNQLLNKVLKGHGGGDAVVWEPHVKCNRDPSSSQALAYDIPLPASISLFVKGAVCF